MYRKRGESNSGVNVICFRAPQAPLVYSMDYYSEGRFPLRNCMGREEEMMRGVMRRLGTTFGVLGEIRGLLNPSEFKNLEYGKIGPKIGLKLAESWLKIGLKFVWILYKFIEN